MFGEDFQEAGDSEQENSGPDICQVLLLLLSSQRDGRPAGQDQVRPPQQAQDRHAQE